MTTSAEHWENIYTTKDHKSVSWFTERPSVSLQLIAELAPAPNTAFLDVGGGASRLAGDLLKLGHSNLSVLDISPRALTIAKEQIGQDGESIHWIQGDVLSTPLAPDSIDIWHDRAAFHFLTAKPDRAAYRNLARSAIKSGGHLIVATFSLNGPARCSGLDIVKYSPQLLGNELGPEFNFVKSVQEDHRTPRGAVQSFVYSVFKVVK